MKTCDHENCSYPVFGSDKKTGKRYCKNHQYLRTDLNKTIRQRSERRAKDEQEYFQIIEDLKSEATYCWICGCEFYDGVVKDAHHVKGREEKLLTDKRWIRIVHRECHSAIHNMPKGVLQRQHWFKHYIKQLSKIDVANNDNTCDIVK